MNRSFPLKERLMSAMVRHAYNPKHLKGRGRKFKSSGSSLGYIEFENILRYMRLCQKKIKKKQANKKIMEERAERMYEPGEGAE